MTEEPRTITFDDENGGTVTMELTADVIRQRGENWKERLTVLYRELAELAFLAQGLGDSGGLASCIPGMTTQEINTWAAVYEQWPGERTEYAIEDLCPLNANWWKAILRSGNPERWREKAIAGELTAAAIREQSGQKRERQGPLYSAPAKFSEWSNGVMRFFVDLSAEPPDGLPEDVMLVVKERK